MGRDGVKTMGAAEIYNSPASLGKMARYLSENGSPTFQPTYTIVNPDYSIGWVGKLGTRFRTNMSQLFPNDAGEL